MSLAKVKEIDCIMNAKYHLEKARLITGILLNECFSLPEKTPALLEYNYDRSKHFVEIVLDYIVDVADFLEQIDLDEIENDLPKPEIKKIDPQQL